MKTLNNSVNNSIFGNKEMIASYNSVEVMDEKIKTLLRLADMLNEVTYHHQGMTGEAYTITIDGKPLYQPIISLFTGNGYTYIIAKGTGIDKGIIKYINTGTNILTLRNIAKKVETKYCRIMAKKRYAAFNDIDGTFKKEIQSFKDSLLTLKAEIRLSSIQAIQGKMIALYDIKNSFDEIGDFLKERESIEKDTLKYKAIEFINSLLKDYTEYSQFVEDYKKHFARNVLKLD